MKKLTLSILVLLALTLAGCEKQTQEQIDADMASRLREFNYKGHRYIRYYNYMGQSSIGGITHDPDCPCHEKGGDDK